ncbi:hypothetical protein AOC36_04135 [Erysipelothrix larvae]|uniref:Uncharacterized protein n=1 Tax=Erysipelothrix larvae TaxID=1514105 RepID=A0A0X8GZA2_9FIRM|nr:hypothetical protein AOC36_04135 [Erysipelothrix larvae]
MMRTIWSYFILLLGYINTIILQQKPILFNLFIFAWLLYNLISGKLKEKKEGHEIRWILDKSSIPFVLFVILILIQIIFIPYDFRW